MTASDNNIIIIGDSAFAEVAYEYFTHDSPYTVVGFAVERAYRSKDTLFGLPVVDLEEVTSHFAPGQHGFHAALVYTQLNRARRRLIATMKELGYQPVSFVSSRACVSPSAKLGEHCFIFEQNVIQPFVTIGEHCVLWSGNHIGHHSSIDAGCFIASHAVISGFVTLGQHCFVGVNATLCNNLTVGDDCVIGAGAMVSRDLAENMVVKPAKSTQLEGARRLFKAEI